VRTGREDDALALLLPHVAHAAVREEVGCLVPWSGEGRLDARTVSALERANGLRVVWSTPPETARGPLAASVLGVVAAPFQHRDGAAAFTVRGVRSRLEGAPCGFAGDVVFTHGRGLEARDFVTGKRLWALPGAGRPAYAAPVLAVVQLGEGLPAVVLHDLPRPRIEPTPRKRIVFRADEYDLDLRTCGERLYVSVRSAETRAFDLASGRELWRSSGRLVHADEKGAVLATSDGETALVTLEGARSLGPSFVPVHVTERFIHGYSAEDSRWSAEDRDSGATLVRPHAARLGPALVGGEMFLGVHGLDDQQLIAERIPAPRFFAVDPRALLRARVDALAAANGLIYAGTVQGILACLAPV